MFIDGAANDAIAAVNDVQSLARLIASKAVARSPLASQRSEYARRSSAGRPSGDSHDGGASQSRSIGREDRAVARLPDFERQRHAASAHRNVGLDGLDRHPFAAIHRSLPADVDALEREILDVGAGRCHAPRDARVVAQRDERHARNRDADHVETRRHQMHLVPHRRKLDLQMRIVGEDRAAAPWCVRRQAPSCCCCLAARPPPATPDRPEARGRDLRRRIGRDAGCCKSACWRRIGWGTLRGTGWRALGRRQDRRR